MKKILIILLIVGVFFSCTGMPRASGKSSGNVVDSVESQDLSQLQGKWLLSALEGKPFSQNPAQKEVFIAFDVEMMQVSGSSGINQFGGPFTVPAPAKITFSPMRSTLMAGLNMETENLLYQAFPRVTAYALSGNVLSLLDENSAVIIEYTKAQ